MKTADLNDVDVLYAVDESCAKGTYVGDTFPEVPGKVIASKLRKLQSRGLISTVRSGYCLTPAGREALAG